ncbi:DNA mismatch repair endonuclease MutL [Thalassotalea sp. G2M2-11]|uniref:DNA mismatch repair endonuclease MutL n=1 Tax=Thalassotalea sp. G2M2-11 TaxID=2787627 RepID=UPI0019D29464|nr:DNA mismatch repair endonuclease MutL [Thalassotalea sp. G2M2-11]
MTIEILPARLANQIAAGEVVERPASVVKELIENSLDAGATSIKVDIEKGGAKRIRISDNGKGIVKDELTLALSRHATSKIKNLSDLEAIGSLGFRGEALASISSVARLTLTSKPTSQENAWQACAQGRDMDVVIQPAAHSDGTTIDVVDLFFNTPARRKFLRTEKTEFNHIEEVLKRIALARFDVAFTLTHNGKTIRQYRIANSDAQKDRRVAQVCGQAFIDHAVKIDCQHDGLELSGWLAQPSYSRNQNDMCYSYVNGRMMRDKLINHAIRQSYQELLTNESYPAFVLFLVLDAKEVDVNVHPAKHEVRFHQGRYVHDFIYSVCHQALIPPIQEQALDDNIDHFASHQGSSLSTATQAIAQAYQQSREYVSQLQQADQQTEQAPKSVNYRPINRAGISALAGENYQRLMTPINLPDEVTEVAAEREVEQSSVQVANSPLHFVAPDYALFVMAGQPRLLSLLKLYCLLQQEKIARQWSTGLTSQPLLLPIKLSLPPDNHQFVEQHQEELNQLGIVCHILDKQSIQIRQYPALLRNQDVSNSFEHLITLCLANAKEQALSDSDWQHIMARVIAEKKRNEFDEQQVQWLYQQTLELKGDEINQVLLLNSVEVDLTSAIQALE